MYQLSTSLTLGEGCPAMVLEATLVVNGEHLPDIPCELIEESKWGSLSPLRVIGEGYETLPEGLELMWVSVLERKAYRAQIGFDKGATNICRSAATKNAPGSITSTSCHSTE